MIGQGCLVGTLWGSIRGVEAVREETALLGVIQALASEAKVAL